jgi:hypothetical protein
MSEHDNGQVHIAVKNDPTERLALDIKAALKASGGRGEPDAQLVDRLLILALHSQATAVRTAARLANDGDDRERLRDLADDLDPFLR